MKVIFLHYWDSFRMLIDVYFKLVKNKLKNLNFERIINIFINVLKNTIEINDIVCCTGNHYFFSEHYVIISFL